MTGLARRRPLAVLLGLLLFHLLLISVQVQAEDNQTLLRSIGLSVVTPFAVVIRGAGDGLNWILDHSAYLVGVVEEKKQLQSELDLLRLENQQLRELVDLALRSPNYQVLAGRYEIESVPASVILRKPPFLGQRLGIDLGRLAGIMPNAPVFTSNGIVGKIWSANPISAEVELITNEKSSVGALIEGARQMGVVQGDGSGILQLHYIPNAAEVAKGARVVTSGSDQIFPKGLPIGVVERSVPGDQGYREITVRPFVNFSQIEELLVSVPSLESREKGSAPASESRPRLPRGGTG